MLANDIRPVLYYFNPNIFPYEEYEKRKNELTRYCSKLGLEVIDGDWDHKAWRKSVSGLELEPERGARCQVCFDVRLASAAKKCHELGLKRFTTTLASSSWKTLQQVDQAGYAAAKLYPDIEYWAKNWRKGGLQERRAQLLRINGFYNQQWCGCEFSMGHMLAKQEKERQSAQRCLACETST